MTLTHKSPKSTDDVVVARSTSRCKILAWLRTVTNDALPFRVLVFQNREKAAPDAIDCTWLGKHCEHIPELSFGALLLCVRVIFSSAGADIHPDYVVVAQAGARGSPVDSIGVGDRRKSCLKVNNGL
jgi:hypothetical protein